MARRGRGLTKKEGWELESFVEKDFFKKFTGEIIFSASLNYILPGFKPSVVLFKRSATHFSFEDRGSAAAAIAGRRRGSQLKDPTTSLPPHQQCSNNLLLLLHASPPLLCLLLPCSSLLPPPMISLTSFDSSKSS